jgi:hypothetical protein
MIGNLENNNLEGKMFMKYLRLSVAILMVFALSGAVFAAKSKSSESSGPQKKAGLTIKGGFDTNGESDPTVKMSSNYSGNVTMDSGDVKTGIMVGAEGLKGINDLAAVGIGASYQFPRGIDETGWQGKFNFANIYGLANLCFTTKGGDFFPYLTLHLGYGYAMMDSTMKDYMAKQITKLSPSSPTTKVDYKGGFYWGIGGGILLSNNLQFEILYNVNNGYAEAGDGYLKGSKIEQEYSKVTLSIGYKF